MSGFKSVIVLSMLAVLSVQAATVINESTEYQTITGLGAFGCGKSGAYSGIWSGAPSTVAPSWYIDSLVNKLGMSICRLEVLPEHSPTSGSFNPAPLTSLQLLYLRRMKDAGCRIFIGSVWSPPCYMKYSRSCINGGGFDPAFYTEFGQYMVKWVKMFTDSVGIAPYGVSLQNECLFDEPYNSCNYFNGDTYFAMMKGSTPALRTAYPNLKIYGPEHMGSYSWNSTFFTTLDGDAAARATMNIYAVHGYLDGITPATADTAGWANLYNKARGYGYPLWMTETSGFTNNWAGAFALCKDIGMALRYGKVSGWVFWTVNGGGVPTGPSTDATYNIMGEGIGTQRYFVAKQYYRFIRPGAVQVACNTGNSSIMGMAFLHKTNGTLTVVLVNVGTSSLTTTLNITGTVTPTSFNAYRTSSTENCVTLPIVASSATITLPAQSITTLFNADPYAVSAAPAPAVQPATAAAAGAAKSYTLQGKRLPPSAAATRMVVISRSAVGKVQPRITR